MDKPHIVHELAKAHWEYVKNLLINHGIIDTDQIGFHYKSAFIHGYKHGVSDNEKKNRTT